MEELIDLYSEDRRPLGVTAERYHKLPDGARRLVVHICVFSVDGKRMIIQKRHSCKRTWPGFWDVSAAGGVMAGEDSALSGERETMEELGLAVKLTGGSPVLTLQSEKTFDDFYLVHSDVHIENLVLQAEEVTDARWATLDEIEVMMREGTFISYHPGIISYLFHVAQNGRCEYVYSGTQ